MLGFISDAAPVVALVIGGTFPILAGSIDLSVAGVASVTGVLVVVLNPVFGPWTSLVVALIALVFGAAQGFVHTWLQLPSFIVTLATLSILSGLALLLSNATAEPVPFERHAGRIPGEHPGRRAEHCRPARPDRDCPQACHAVHPLRT